MSKLKCAVCQLPTWLPDAFLNGDVEWLKQTLHYPEHPDAPRLAVALVSFMSEFARRPCYDYWDRGDWRAEALFASPGARSLPRPTSKLMSPDGSPRDTPNEPA